VRVLPDLPPLRSDRFPPKRQLSPVDKLSVVIICRQVGTGLSAARKQAWDPPAFRENPDWSIEIPLFEGYDLAVKD